MGPWSSSLALFFTALATSVLMVANLGSYKKGMGLNSIFLLEVNFRELNMTSVFSGVSSTYSDLVSEFEDLDNITLSDLGMTDVFTFSLYGYCEGTSRANETKTQKVVFDQDFSVSSCSSPKPMYYFNPQEFLAAQLSDITGFSFTSDEITMPTKIEKYITTEKYVARTSYVTSCIAIGLNFVVFIVGIFFLVAGRAFLMPHLGWVEGLAFLAAILASGCSTGMSVYISKAFNEEASKYGIKAEISRNYMIFTWIGTVASLIALLLLGCHCFCCMCRSRANQEAQYQQTYPETQFNQGNTGYTQTTPGYTQGYTQTNQGYRY